MPIKIIVNNNDINKALKKFKKKIKQSNLLMEYINRQFYYKPSEIKKIKYNKVKNKLQKI